MLEYDPTLPFRFGTMARLYTNDDDSSPFATQTPNPQRLPMWMHMRYLWRIEINWVRMRTRQRAAWRRVRLGIKAILFGWHYLLPYANLHEQNGG